MKRVPGAAQIVKEAFLLVSLHSMISQQCVLCVNFFFAGSFEELGGPAVDHVALAHRGGQ